MEGVPKNRGFGLVRFHVGVAQPVIATAYGLDDRGSIPGRGKIFPFSTASRPALGPIQYPPQWVTGSISPGINFPGRETDSSLLSSAEVKNAGAIPPLPRMSSWSSI
jgi:hypothetical protein